jgi:uncharacterized protein YndB with AHSA1/START domain
MTATATDTTHTTALAAPAGDFGTLTDATTLRLQRRLPGTLARAWAWLTDSELRRQWLAAGEMTLVPGSSFELVWRNDELSGSPAERPEGFSAESRATCQLLEVVPLQRLRFTWPGVGEVTWDLAPDGDGVLFTITHRQLPERRVALLVGPGWHSHADILRARAQGRQPPSLWASFTALRGEYERRLGA